MKFKDIETTPEEVIQSLKDAGIEILEPGDSSFKEGLTFEQLCGIAEKEVLLDDLYDIVVELGSRGVFENQVVDRLQNFSWNELCDKSIEILEKLKKL